ncbi:hypothetical protein JTB14_016688 [Gonioctena quinquepunctata]|nr:hypothetical protein JTB14_016688 [Gonioctena quinquepunctata]
MECAICKIIKQPTKENKYPCYPCDSCRNLICAECSDLSPSEIKCLPLQKRLMKFHCSKCRNNDFVEILKNTIKDKEDIITNKNEIIKLLQDKLRIIEEKITLQKPSYLDVTKNNSAQTNYKQQSTPEIIIKPKTNQVPGQTMRDVNQNINPSHLKIGISKMRSSNTGTVTIKCKSKREVDILEQKQKQTGRLLRCSTHSNEETKSEDNKLDKI